MHARVTSYGYDDRGNLTSTMFADGSTETSHYDVENRRDWSEDRLGRRTRYVYDELGRLRFTIHPDATPGDDTDNPRAETVYDLIGRVTQQIDERGAITEFTYEDGCGCAMRRKEMIQVLSTGDLITSYDYDKAGNVRFVTDPRGNTTETRYDEHGRPITIVHPATDEHPSTQTVTTYDVLGRRVAVTDQEGKITRYRYDGLGRLIEVRQYLDASAAALDSDAQLSTLNSQLVSTRYSYDELGNQLTQTDALDRTTTYWVDAMGRRTQRILPKDASEATALSETLQYDGWGNLWKRTDFAGKTTTFTYDALNRLKSKAADSTHSSLAYSHAIARTEYDYDANGARTAARTYNALGAQLYAETTPRDERGRTDYKDTAAGRLDYDYYANGLLKDVVSSNANGVNLGYRYDELNRLAYVDDATNGIPPRTHAYSYNANGSLESVTYANGLSHVYTYDTLNRLRGLQVGAVVPNSPGLATVRHGYTYRLRASGHRREVVDSDARYSLSATRSYQYDDLYRLTGETIANDPNGNNGTVSYALDKVGNRQSRTSSVSSVPSVLSQSYNSRDWLTTDTYDANGNTVGAVVPSGPGSTSVVDSYDFENRLILRTKSDGTQINIAYDADGVRIQKTLLDASANVTSSTNYLVDTNNLTGYAQVFEERTTSGQPAVTTVKTYTYGSDLISVATSLNAQPSTLNYYLHDGGGTVRELADESGTITDRYDYDAFGLLIHRSGTTDNAYLYRGEQWDDDLGLYYNRARYLNPDSGRFWSMDEFEGDNQDPYSLHKYLYANANPVKFSDPSGRSASVAQLGAVGAIIGTLVALALPSTQRIIRDFGEVAIGVAGEIGESALGKGLAAIASGIAAYESLREEIEKAEEALTRAGKRIIRRLKVVPIPRSIIPKVAAHVASVQGGVPQMLTRTDSAQAKRNRRAAIAGRGSAGLLKSWDEYPFASTTQGGAAASVCSVPLHENLIQGGIIGASYRIQNINVGDNFWVIVTP